ncbi:mannose-6-phosphate isomerase [Winogradskyella sp. PC-19]|uniref:type I phosphomannose isomerase catalytic subunit n=1 Tax=unclassified Winogradskyella TaxID=2615021 RepID=UPI000B3C769E|nr:MULTISPECIES: type I phosphomannose isomerase catalytic subunit [unclassified Winogradskyella]ARV10439.1 mannose-6-phosphate isomerase [Winogradskyella sp. PC-19]RZN75496.1 MAG: mannose-6-phosphate isomerase [Winogradskyella sp.]
MQQNLHPLKFSPILKDKIWGGQKISKYLNKPSDSNQLGESWEISAVEGDTSVVFNGELKGKSLKQLLEEFKSDLVGHKNYAQFGNKFPLLIKFIDAKQDLSIQLHPNDRLAAERHNSFGKTEMWHVMQADNNSNLIVGFNQKVTPKKYLQHLENKTLTEILNFDKVKKGDTYFIEVGRVHAIGAGVMLAEIQQTSDITYRVYDWDRVDDHGNERELHNDLAIDAIDFDMQDNFRVQYSTSKNQSNKMVSCQYFTTNYIHLNTEVKKQNTLDSFVIYICTEGSAKITTDFGIEIIKKGETLLLPAVIKNYSIQSDNAELLEVYV